MTAAPNISAAATAPDAPDAGVVTRIKPCPGLSILNPRALWRHRDLGLMLALRDVQVRYKQTALGALWAVIQPLAMMTVAALVLGRLLGLSEKVHGSYAVFVYAGMLPWMLFSATVTSASGSLVSHAEVLRKVYFPRLLVPVSSTGVPLVDCGASMVVLLGVMAVCGQPITASLGWAPLAVGSILLAGVGLGTALAALTVRFRDFRLVVPFMLQMWFFLTPVVYPLPVSPKWSWVLSLNPVDGPIRVCRSAVLGQPIDGGAWLASTCVGGLMLIAGLVCFARSEHKFADVV